MWRLSMGKNRSLSAGLPASITRSRIKPLRPAVRLSFVAVLNLAAARDDDVGVRLEQADDLLVGGESLAMENATLALRDDALDQRTKGAELGPPQHDRDRVERLPHQRRGLIGIGQGRPRQLEQLTIMRDPVFSTAGISDGLRPLLRRAPVIAPLETADQGLGGPQQPHHHAHPIPEKRAVARLMHERKR